MADLRATLANFVNSISVRGRCRNQDVQEVTQNWATHTKSTFTPISRPGFIGDEPNSILGGTADWVVLAANYISFHIGD
jgi:hypothetical protein